MSITVCFCWLVKVTRFFVALILSRFLHFIYYNVNNLSSRDHFLVWDRYTGSLQWACINCTVMISHLSLNSHGSNSLRVVGWQYLAAETGGKPSKRRSKCSASVYSCVMWILAVIKLTLDRQSSLPKAEEDVHLSHFLWSIWFRNPQDFKGEVTFTTL